MRPFRPDPKLEVKPKTKKGFKKSRKPTGERELFIKMYEGGKKTSWISGQPLVPPEHPVQTLQTLRR